MHYSFIILCSVSVIACQMTPPVETSKKEPIAEVTIPAALMITKQDAGKTVTIKTGQKLRITLDSNQTTGYSWHIKKLDQKFLTKISQSYQATQQQGPPIAGSGGTETIVLKGLKTGTTDIELRYKRPWEQDKPNDTHFKLKITIQ